MHSTACFSWNCSGSKGKASLMKKCIGDESQIMHFDASLIKVGLKLGMMFKDCTSVLKGTAIWNI